MGYKKIDPFMDRVKDHSRRAGKKVPRGKAEGGATQAVRVLANFGGLCLAAFEDGRQAVLPIHRHLAAAAGDIGESDGERILALRPRSKVLARSDANRMQVIAANIDLVALVQSVSSPPFKSGLTDRYRLFTEIMALPLVLVLNKIDEAAPGTIEQVRAETPQEVEFLPVSAKTGEGMDAFARRLRGTHCVLSGHSGVGKSSLLRHLLPEEVIDIGELHPTFARGRQKTTTARAYPFGDGFLIDTPGVRQFGFVGVRPRDVDRAFPDIAAAAAECRFADCRHDIEPGCAVKAALAEGNLDRERYSSYRRIVVSLLARDRTGG